MVITAAAKATGMAAAKATEMAAVEARPATATDGQPDAGPAWRGIQAVG